MAEKVATVEAGEHAEKATESPGAPSPLDLPTVFRRFKNQNQAHCCCQFTVERLLDGKPSELVELYDRFAICENSGSVVLPDLPELETSPQLCKVRLVLLPGRYRHTVLLVQMLVQCFDRDTFGSQIA